MAKKIGAIVSLVLIAVVIIAAIVMVNIDIDYSIDCVKPDYVWVQTSDKEQHITTSEQKDKIVELISGASKQNALTALFDGELKKKAEVFTLKSTISNPSNFYVRYKYTTKQELIVNGKKYKDADGKVETYEELVFVVNDVEGEQETKVYVIPESDQVNATSYYFSLDANFEDLFSYLNENFK